MNYYKIVQGILDIGEGMLRSGAENFRLEDSFYRMCRSYGFVKSDVFVIPSNIQVTVETPEGEIITQIRHVNGGEPNFDRLDYLNNLCRYVCQNTPDEKELREYDVRELKFKPKRRKEKGGKGEKSEHGERSEKGSGADRELRELEALEKKEGKSKLDD